MKIHLTKSDFLWSVTWTLDGVSWRTRAFDTFRDALELAARIGGGPYPTGEAR
jgi:hypothetical protein